MFSLPGCANKQGVGLPLSQAGGRLRQRKCFMTFGCVNGCGLQRGPIVPSLPKAANTLEPALKRLLTVRDARERENKELSYLSQPKARKSDDEAAAVPNVLPQDRFSIYFAAGINR